MNALYRVHYQDPLLTTVWRGPNGAAEEVWREAVDWGIRHGYGFPKKVTKTVNGREKVVRRPPFLKEEK